MTEIIREGIIDIKFIECQLYVCNSCREYFKVNEMDIGVIYFENGTEEGNHVNFERCPNCKSDRVTLHKFSLRSVN